MVVTASTIILVVVPVAKDVCAVVVFATVVLVVIVVDVKGSVVVPELDESAPVVTAMLAKL